MVVNGLFPRGQPAVEPAEDSIYDIHPAMAVVFVILALTLCLLFWALWEALSHLWRMRLRQSFAPVIEEHPRPTSPTSTAASSPAPETPRDLEKGLTSSEEPSIQPKFINAPPRIIINGDFKLTGKTPGAHLTKTSPLGVHTGPKIFSASLVSDEDFVIPPRGRISDDGDITPTPPPSSLFITNPSPTETEAVPEHFEDVALNASGSQRSTHQSSQ